MGSTALSTPRILVFKAGGAIALGQAVKFSGTDGKTVVKATAATDKIIGINQSVTTVASGDQVEIALPGGGGVGTAGGTIAAGDFLTADSSGDIVATTTENDRVIGMAMVDAVDNDVFAVELIAGVH